ncbi:MFS transporter [Streptomyces novaecaesareae]|uniref:MFS transporter n=1 Tax=Streptomyces novaecaesareae TaxID=68244 RepID=UPI00068BCA4A|nr:MFS transporter [Streptomyces novaecaesareae]
MSTTAPGRATAATLLLSLGGVIVLVSSAVAFQHSFAMDPAMPMDHMSADPGRKLHGMALSDMPEMFTAVAGLLLVVVGAALRGRPKADAADTRTSRRGRLLIAAIGTAALTIDISKTSTLGFVIPGMRAEYGLDPRTASLLAVSGLSGTAVGAVLFGVLTDRIGRRSSYLIATLGFTATSMCGSMPTFHGNLVMCALMGLAVGGLAPLLITLLTETVGGPVRGSVVVALSVVATAVGYLIAAGSALWLEPVFGWRILWLIGAPTGAALALLTPFVPNRGSARAPAARRTPVVQHLPNSSRTLTHGLQRAFATLIGLLTFGLSTWVPSLARIGGVPVHTANLMLTVAAVAMIPCALLLMVGYRRFGPTSMAAGLATATAVLLVALTASGAVAKVGWICAGALVAALFSVNSMAAIFLPIAADLADPERRGRTTGLVSLFNRLGGLTGPLLLASLVSSASAVLLAVSVLALLCGAAAWYISRRSRLAAVALAPAAD